MKEDFHHEIEGTKGTVTAKTDQGMSGELTYTIAPPSTLIIDHTHVEDSARGTGVGLRLVEFVIGYADDNKYKILPLCPFAKAQFSKNTQWNYILK